MIMMPVLMLKELSALKYCSFVSFVFILYTIIVSIVQTPGYYENCKDSPNYEFEPLIRPFKLKWLQGIATISMSYICHPLFFNVRRELIENNPRRINKVIYSSIFFEMFIYLAMVIAGYISLGNNLQVPLFTERPSYDKNSGDI